MISVFYKIIKCEMFYLLRFRYRFLFFVSTMLGILAFLPLLFNFGQWVTEILGIPPNLPVKNHPYGLIYLVIVLFAFTFFTVIGSILGNFALALLLNLIGGYSREELRNIFFENKVPEHWIIKNK